MAEAILRHVGEDCFEAFSAGCDPAGFVHPLAVEAMRRMDISMDGHVSKSWDEFAQTPIDVVITLCDHAAKETCPVWAGNPVTAHWSLPDPAYHPGTEDDRIEFTVRVVQRLRAKIEGLVNLDWPVDPAELSRHLGFLGEI